MQIEFDEELSRLKEKVTDEMGRIDGKLANTSFVQKAPREIVEQLDVSQPTVSHHLAILREAGLVTVREEGKQSFYSLNQENVAICCGQLMIKFAPESVTTRDLLKIIKA